LYTNKLGEWWVLNGKSNSYFVLEIFTISVNINRQHLVERNTNMGPSERPGSGGGTTKPPAPPPKPPSPPK